MGKIAFYLLYIDLRYWNPSTFFSPRHLLEDLFKDTRGTSDGLFLQDTKYRNLYIFSTYLTFQRFTTLFGTIPKKTAFSSKALVYQRL